MNTSTKDFLKHILIYDIIICAIFLVISIFISTDFKTILCFVIGIICAYTNLKLNAVVSDYVFSRNKGQGKGIMAFTFLFRVVGVCIIGVLLYITGTWNLILYIIGYTCQFLSLLAYTFKLKSCQGEGK